MVQKVDLAYWLALSKIKGLGAGNFKKLYNYFPDMAAAFAASSASWQEAGLGQEIVAEFYLTKNKINPEQLLKELAEEKIKAVTILDADYPSLLKEIYNAPPILYYRGTLPLASDPCVAVVGTRKISTYGRQVTSDIVSSLVQNRLTIVSGLALGVDALAHQTTLDNQGKTIAVLGSGIDKASLYPAANYHLVEKIIENGGAIISEYAPKTLPTKFNFPARNRLISGLSLGSLIIEADEKSGALITAQFALEQNREVLAVPGSIYSTYSKGTNALLKQGARLVTSAQDVLEALNLEQFNTFAVNKQILPDNLEEGLILNLLSLEPLHIDFLVKQSQLNSAVVSSTLVLMEMKGKVKNLGGMNYVLSR